MSYSEYWSYFHSDLIHQFGQHLAVVVLATLLGAAIGTSAGIAVYRAPRASEVVLKACGVLLTVPSLALYVLLLGLLGLGWPPVLTALTLHSLLPIVRNTVVGLRGVDPATVEAAAGIGMSRVRRLARVELPMAWPVILAGIRVGGLLLVSTATIGAIVRGPGLGNAIYDGLNRIGTPTAEDGWVGDWRGDAFAFRFQPPPVEPCMRFSRTRLTDVLHRRRSTGARQARFGLGATTVPLRLTRPSLLPEWMSMACP